MCVCVCVCVCVHREGERQGGRECAHHSIRTAAACACSSVPPPDFFVRERAHRVSPFMTYTLHLCHIHTFSRRRIRAQEHHAPWRGVCRRACSPSALPLHMWSRVNNCYTPTLFTTSPGLDLITPPSLHPPPSLCMCACVMCGRVCVRAYKKNIHTKKHSVRVLPGR